MGIGHWHGVIAKNLCYAVAHLYNIHIVPVTILDRENSAIAAREEKQPKLEECA